MMLKRNIVFLICALLSGTAFAQQVSRSEQDSIFAAAKRQFARHYHFREAVQPTIAYLDAQWKKGRYASFQTVESFTQAISQDMQHITRDKHLNFYYDPAEIARSAQEAPSIPWGLVNEKFLNNGLNSLQVLPGDIGYMRIQAFGSFDEVAPGAFAFLQGTRALIIDLRGNGGGMLSNLVLSYLLPEDSIHVNTIYWNDRTDSIFTYRRLAGPRYLHKPVFVLTDKGTFSSAEEFAYDLQNLKRATIVGETTGGGANPGGIVPIHFFPEGGRLGLFVPMGHVENPISKTNWEGKGVQPDVATDPKEALTRAHILALETLAPKEENKLIRKKYHELIARLRVAQ